jgi:protein-disulfide isomerase
VYDLPSPGNAVGALVAATCVATIEPEKYWPYRSLLFASHDQWMKAYPPEPLLIGLANSIGIDSVALKVCIEQHGSGLSADATALAQTVVAGGLNSTPGWSLQDSVFLTAEVSDRLRLLERRHQR